MSGGHVASLSHHQARWCERWHCHRRDTGHKMDHVMHDPCYASQAYLSQNIFLCPCLSQNIAQLIWLCACIPWFDCVNAYRHSCMPTCVHKTMIKRIYMHINENMQCSDIPISLLQSHLFLHAIVHVSQISSKVQRSSIIRMGTPRIELASSHIFHLTGTASKMEYMRGCQSNSNRVTGLARREPCHNRLLSEMQHEVFGEKKMQTRLERPGKTVWQLCPYVRASPWWIFCAFYSYRLIGKLKSFLQLQEFSSRKPTTTFVLWCSPHNSSKVGHIPDPHSRQVCNTTDYDECRRNTYSF